MSSAPVIEGYEDLEPIGSGGFSHVYRARQAKYERWVAVKVLTATNLDERTRRRFERECRLTGRLTGHPHIVTVLDSGFTEAGSPFLTTEYYAQGSLADRMATTGPLDVQNTLSIGVKVAGALETAHRAGVLHRDVKPQNVLVSAFGEPALGDFGISLAVLRTESATHDALTPHHAPPEVLEGDTSHPTSDIYSLGSTLYCLLAGRAPFATMNADTETEGIMQVLRRIMTEPLPPIARDDVPEVVRAAIETSMAKDAGDRFTSPLAFGEALQDAQHAIGLAPTPLVCPRPGQPWDLPGDVDGVAGAASSGDSEVTLIPREAPELVEIRLDDVERPGETRAAPVRLVVGFEDAHPAAEPPTAAERLVVDLTDDAEPSGPA